MTADTMSALIIFIFIVVTCHAAEDPYFDPELPTEQTVPRGTTAELPCKLYNNGNRKISWIKQEDKSLLIDDYSIKTKDERIDNNYLDYPPIRNNLIISHTNDSDDGDYICRISDTEPPMERVVRLNIVEPVIEIVGPSEVTVKEYTLFEVECNVQHLDARGVAHLDWELNSKTITHKYVGTLTSYLKNSTRSVITFKPIISRFEGTLTCMSEETSATASILIHIEKFVPEPATPSSAVYSQHKIASTLLIVASLLLPLL